LAHLFATAEEALVERSAENADDKPRLVWLHARGMYGPWDAPLELQESLRDENDPAPFESTLVPDTVVGDDPDAVFRYSSAYAAQIMVLDDCWSGLLETLRAASERNEGWLVMLLGARGFPLGEHGQIGGVDSRLYAEQLHVPMLIQFPDQRGWLARSDALASPLDLLPTLVDFLAIGVALDAQAADGLSLLPLVASADAPRRDALIAWSPAGQRAIRTADWCLRQDLATDRGSTFAESRSPHGAADSHELFVRPDDRWEANDVAKLRPEMADELSGVLDEVEKSLANGEPIRSSLLRPSFACS
jgi:arylsulfatase A-like enzyme